MFGEGKKYVFPNYIFQKSTRILIYGAGNIGKQFYVQAKTEGYVNIVGIIDIKGENASWFDEKQGNITVNSIECLSKIDFEYILVAIFSGIQAREITKCLISKGVSEEQILWPGSFDTKDSLYCKLYTCFNGDDKTHSLRFTDSKKVILMIDYSVPRYDYSAGDRHTFQYLKLLSKFGYHVIYYPQNNFWVEPYASELIEAGVELLAGFHWNHISFKRWLEDNGEKIDFAYLHRPDISITYIDAIKMYTNAKIIYYPHDLYYLRWERESKILQDNSMQSQIEKYKEVDDELINKSDIIHTVGEYETNYLKERFPDKVVHEVPIYAYDDEFLNQLPAVDIRDRKNIMFVGGFGHSPNVDAIRWFMERIYPVIANKISDVTFYIVGSNVPDKIAAYQSDHSIVTGYVTDEELDELYAKARVIVVPLRYGAGVKGKVVEAMLSGVPVVTTSIGAEGFSNIDKCVRICDEPAGFSEAVIQLMQDDKMWYQMADGGRRYVREHFACKRVKEILLQDFGIRL